MEQIIQNRFKPTYFELEDESHKHNVPLGSESHFRALIVSSEFDGKTRVARQQSVYGEFGEEFKLGLHAFALHCFTKQEWEQKNDKSWSSPDCQHKKSD